MLGRLQGWCFLPSCLHGRRPEPVSTLMIEVRREGRGRVLRGGAKKRAQLWLLHGRGRRPGRWAGEEGASSLPGACFPRRGREGRPAAKVLLLALTGALWVCGKLALEVREGWRCQVLGAH